MNTKEIIIKSAIEKIIEDHLPSHYLAKKGKDVLEVVKPKSNFVLFGDAGHGGENPKTGTYQSPRKQHVYNDGFSVYEGILNRKVWAKTLELAKDLPFELRYESIAHEWKDTPLRERTNKINKYCDLYGVENCELLSIHHNGHGNPSANGIEIYYWGYNGTSFSVKGAKSAIIYNDKQSIYMSEFRNRGVKFANFHMIREVKCTGILAEGAFMTNREDTEEMVSERGILSYAKTNIAWIIAMNEKHA